MTRTPLNLTTPSFIENPRSFQLSARSFITKHWDFLQEADGGGVLVLCFGFFFLLFKLEFSGITQYFVLKSLKWKFLSRPYWVSEPMQLKVQSPDFQQAQIWCLRRLSPKGFELLACFVRFLFPFFFSFSRTQHQEFSESRTEANMLLPVVSSQEKTELASALRA